MSMDDAINSQPSYNPAPATPPAPTAEALLGPLRALYRRVDAELDGCNGCVSVAGEALGLATTAITTLARERDEAVARAERNDDIDRMNLESAQAADASYDEAKAAFISEMTEAGQRYEKLLAEQGKTIGYIRKLSDLVEGYDCDSEPLKREVEAFLDAAEARLAGAPPPVAPSPVAEQRCFRCAPNLAALCIDCAHKQADERGAPPPVAPAAKVKCERCDGLGTVMGRHEREWCGVCHATGEVAGDVAAPPSEPADSPRRVALWDAINEFADAPGKTSIARQRAVVKVERALRAFGSDAADLESLRADRELLRAWGESMRRIDRGEHTAEELAQAFEDHSEAEDGITERALALAAQGRGKDGGR